MRSPRLLGLLLIPGSLVAAQQPASHGPGLSLDDAIAVAQQNNPQFQQTKNLLRNANGTVRETYGALLPTANFGYSSQYTQGGAQYFDGVQLGASSATYNSYYNLGVGYSISPSIAFAPRAARANRAASEANITSTSATLRSNVTEQYIQTLEQQATAVLDDSLVQSAQGNLDLANAKLEVGAGTILDVRNAEVTVGQAQVTALQAHNQARIEKLKLFQLMGVAPDTAAVLTSTFTLTPPPGSLDSLLQIARRVNPDLAAKKSTEFADEMQAHVAQSSYLPSLNLSTGIGGSAFGYANINEVIANQQAEVRAQDPNVTQFQLDSLASQTRAGNRPFAFHSAPLSFSAGFSLPLFNGFQRELNIEEAEVNRDNATYDVKARDQQLVTDVTTAYLNLVTDRQTVDMQQKNAEAATEALAFAEESYKAGAQTFLQVTTARGQYEQAVVARLNAVYQYHKDFAALESAVGRPLR